MSDILDFTTPQVLRNGAEYTAAIQEIGHLLDADLPPGSEVYEWEEGL